MGRATPRNLPWTRRPREAAGEGQGGRVAAAETSAPTWPCQRITYRGLRFPTGKEGNSTTTPTTSTRVPRSPWPQPPRSPPIRRVPSSKALTWTSLTTCIMNDIIMEAIVRLTLIDAASTWRPPSILRTKTCTTLVISSTYQSMITLSTDLATAHTHFLPVILFFIFIVNHFE